MVYTKLTRKAMAIAYEAHKDQYDKDGVPYIYHPIIVAQSMDDEISTCAALLHDVIEDTSLTLEDLAKSGIPKDVCDVIDLLTHREGTDYFEYIRKIRQNPVAVKVKLADIAHNNDPSRPAKLDERAKARIERYNQAKKILLS